MDWFKAILWGWAHPVKWAMQKSNDECYYAYGRWMPAYGNKLYRHYLFYGNLRPNRQFTSLMAPIRTMRQLQVRSTAPTMVNDDED